MKISSTLPPSSLKTFTLSESVKTISVTRLQDKHLTCSDVEWKEKSTLDLIWIETGNVSLNLDGQRMVLNSNTLVCIPPGYTHTLYFHQPLTGYHIAIGNQFIDSLQLSMDLNSFLSKHHPDTIPLLVYPNQSLAIELMDITAKLKKEFDNSFNLRSEILIGYVQILLMYIMRNVSQEEQEPNCRGHEIMQRFTALLQTNFISMRKVNEYADELCITANYLNKTVKRMSGETVSYHIHQQLLAEAKRQALLTSSSLKEVSINLGFNDCAHFSKFFKRNIGVTFTDYRKSRA